MENKPLPEEAATSNDQVQNTKSTPVPPSKQPTEEFITDNAAVISELLKTPSGLRSRRSQDRHYSIHPR
ncbi:hypothetical protein TNCV_7721 [Trichonephila clavipes]|nr:hypothetical protein TNCV_7721 [Trichonephila clavipes]